MTRLITGLDIETTGLDYADGHKIIEIAAVVYDADTRIKRGSYVARINPQRSILVEAFRVHGIALSDLVGCPEFKEVAPNIDKIMRASSMVIAHNGIGFDMPFVNHELVLAGFRPIQAPCFDTMIGARWATPQGKLPNLGELCFACGVDYDPSKAHGAAYDTDVMLQSFFRATDWGFFTPPIDLSLKAAA